MSNRVLFFVQGRPRSFSLVANMPGRSFKPKHLKTWQGRVAMVAQAAIAKSGITLDDAGPYRVDLVFCFTTKKTKTISWFLGRPDSDNLRKAVQDAMQDLLPDDSRVVLGETAKIYHPTLEGVFVFIDAKPDSPLVELERMGFSMDSL